MGEVGRGRTLCHGKERWNSIQKRVVGGVRAVKESKLAYNNIWRPGEFSAINTPPPIEQDVVDKMISIKISIVHYTSRFSGYIKL